MESQKDNTSYSIANKILTVHIHTSYLDLSTSQLQTKTGEMVFKHSIKGVLIDLSNLDILDSYQMRLLVDLAKMCRILGASTVFTGLKPEIITAVVDLGFDDMSLEIAVDFEHGTRMLRDRIK